MVKKTNATLKFVDKRIPSLSQARALTDKIVAMDTAYREGYRDGRLAGAAIALTFVSILLISKALIWGA